jgi:hypothetical protein
MKCSLVSLAVLSVALLQAHVSGQGQFLFNTMDPAADNYVLFLLSGAPASGSDLFVQVLAGPDRDHMTFLTPLLPLNQTGAMVGFPNPTMQVFEVPGMRAGSQAAVGYVAFEGGTLLTASMRSPLNLSVAPVTLTEPPSEPNEVHLGSVRTVPVDFPEPGTMTLGMIGLCSVLLHMRKRVGR